MNLDNNLHISFVHDCISLHVNQKEMIYGRVDDTVILSSLLPIWHIRTMYNNINRLLSTSFLYFD